ncbi:MULTISPECIES: carbohydrate ABC transporter permease [unclassified Microbacterium]|uniref:carbohydrate ABC transporter permease n=1 Tax=unclassified Microbacterium TaxID=2609290 RepID=UPI001AC07E0A|nr:MULTISPECIES: sugar ABC transporter permease [unclassified Microbacterium]MBN9158808.1 sugar ABC transporter permease [Microbacterium sp.]MBS1899814.1 sugar ABC transporter permease [Actinomycetota bacterium]
MDIVDTARPASAASTATEALLVPSPARRRRRRTQGKWWIPWVFLAPALLLFLVFRYIPMVQAVSMSVENVRPYLGNEFVGLANYQTILSSTDFRDATINTLVLALGQTAGSLGVGFLLALLLEGQTRKLSFLRSAAFLPVVVPMAVIAELWRIMYYPAADGFLNSIIGFVGLGPSEYINDPSTAMGSIMVMGIWRGAPYDMMIILAGLAGIDRGLYEAATVDGANRWQRILHVTLPGLRPVFTILFILAAVRGFRVFTEVFLMTNGGPNGATEVVMTLLYKLGLEQGKLGVGSAGAVLLFLATLVLTVFVQLITRRRKDA